MKSILIAALSLGLSSLGWAQGEATGTLKATTRLFPDGSKATTIVDPDKRTAEETVETEKGKILRKTVWALNENNFAISATFYDAKGGVRYKERYTLDSMNRVKESFLLSATGQAMGRRVFVYDAKGKTQIEDYDANGALISRPAPVSPGRPDKPTVRKASPVR